MRIKTKTVKIGDICIGAEYPIAIQSMANTDTKDIEKTVSQIGALQNAGCEIVRVAVYDKECAKALSTIKNSVKIPLVADIHFDYKLAVLSIENGVDKVRINPGNIGGKSEIKMVADAAKAHKIPIRIGANAGSLSKSFIHKYSESSANALFESAMENIRLLEACNFTDIVVSIKSSSANICVKAGRLMSKVIDYPLHIGVTEAGTYNSAIIKSSAAIGALLFDGIGDTIRVSITGDPVNEVKAAKEILKYCGVRRDGIEIISCPTCARCTLDLEEIANRISIATKDIKVPITVAVMGCGVNGPGEAKEADLGVAGGKGEGLIFKGGRIIKKVQEDRILSELMCIINEIQQERGLSVK